MGTAQYYFESKEKLFEAALDLPFREVFGVVEEVVGLILAKKPRDEIIRTAVSRGFRVGVKWRSALRLNLLLIFERGIMHPRRRAEEDALLEHAGEIAGSVLELPARDARLLLKSMVFVTMRYALSADDELRRFVAAPPDAPIEGILDVVEQHVVALACSFARANVPSIVPPLYLDPRE
jgi:AcrR family transcriptional regulator